MNFQVVQLLRSGAHQPYWTCQCGNTVLRNYSLIASFGVFAMFQLHESLIEDMCTRATCTGGDARKGSELSIGPHMAAVNIAKWMPGHS
jgi:hypothetical protein